MKIEEIVLRKLDLPLVKAYKVSYRAYTSFDPFVVEVIGQDGQVGWGEGLVSPGSSAETQDGGWRFLTEHAQSSAGHDSAAVKACVIANLNHSPIAATALITAVEMMERNEVLCVARAHRVPLLALVIEHDLAKIQAEIDRHVAAGFKALKVKIGFDFERDLERVAAIQAAAAGRATITLDANRAYDRETAIRFAGALDPAGIDQLEQPCAADDWESSAAVARASKVPLMLDESIMTLADIERAADIPGVRFLKLKLRKLGSLELLAQATRRIEALGMSTVLGDGTSTEIHCWMEACVARLGVTTPGQMNGFLKIRNGLFASPLRFDRGDICLEPGFWPEIDRAVLQKHTIAAIRAKAKHRAA